MRSYYKQARTEKAGMPKSLVVFFILLCMAIIGFGDVANAQRTNQSDWNVPPPLAPGTTTKGDIDGRAGNSGVAVLAFVDVPTAIQAAAAAPFIELAPVSITPPGANQPQQPEPVEVLAALPDVPVPEIPEMPGMPERTIQDMPEPIVIDLPMPTAPEMPPAPKEPTGNAIQNISTSGLLPLMPEVNAPAVIVGPPPGSTLFTTPGVPQTIDFKLIRTN